MFDDDDYSTGIDDSFDDSSSSCTDCFDTTSLNAECMWHDLMGTFSSDMEA